jgi:hypothetical protein
VGDGAIARHVIVAKSAALMADADGVCAATRTGDAVVSKVLTSSAAQPAACRVDVIRTWSRFAS